jgi:precorrin isomerase
MIHTTGDFSIMKAVRFSPGAISSAVKALKNGSSIYVDSNMIRSGLSRERLKAVSKDYGSDRIFCHIADEDVAKLFERFHRGGNASAQPGTGLGLAIVRAVMDVHGGSVEVRTGPHGS